MPLTITPLSPVFGARVSGLNTGGPASAADAAEVRRLLAKYKLVIIEGDKLDAEQVGEFGRSLGLGPTKEFGAKHLSGNLASTKDSAVAKLEYGPDLPAANINLWHQDHTWHSEPTRYELSYADVVAVGGDVLYADAVAAYASLSPKMQQMIDGTKSKALLANGYAELPYPAPAFAQSMLKTPPVEQPVVTLVDGERVLTVNKAYSVRITDLSVEESAMVLKMLTDHISRPEHCVRVSYKVKPSPHIPTQSPRIEHVGCVRPPTHKVPASSLGTTPTPLLPFLSLRLCPPRRSATYASSTTTSCSTMRSQITTLNLVVFSACPSARRR